MPSTRSESGQYAGREAWGLALLITAAVFLTSQALGAGLSPQFMLILAFTLLGSAQMLQRVARWSGFGYVKTLLLMTMLGHLGMLLGVALDFGDAGLVMLAGWCSTRSGAGLGDLWSKLGIAPWGHVGMLIGCNLGMLLSGCGNSPPVRRGMPAWLFLTVCNLGMLLGLLVLELWQPAVSGDLRQLALIIVVQMLLAMAVGMAGTWWLTQRICETCSLGMAPLDERGT